MARAALHVVVRLADWSAFKLLYWTLRDLERNLRLEGHPEAERLEQALDRWDAAAMRGLADGDATAP